MMWAMRLLSGLCVLLLAACAGPIHAAPAGSFQVSRVLTDPKVDQAHARFLPDDPRLVGRLVEWGPTRAAIDDGTAPCTTLSKHDRRTTAGAAISGALRTTPATLGLGVGAKTPVVVTSYACSGAPGVRIPGKEWTGAVSLALGDGRNALVWRNEVVLVLSPVSASAKHQAGFPCAQAQSVSEKTICGNRGLANWDRSVAAAYAIAQSRGDDAAKLQAEQRAWIATRAACAANVDCLRSAMIERSDALLR